MWTEEDDRLIQRCVDNELTTAERHELMKRLDQIPEGWKQLACTYLEEQLFASAALDADRQIAVRLAGSSRV